MLGQRQAQERAQHARMTADAEALLRRPALRLGPAFEILDIGNTTGF